MPNITADQIVNHSMYAKGNVNALDYTFKNIAKTFSVNDLIGTVYSYYVNDKGDIYWMFYLTPQDYNNQTPVYVLHNSSLLDVPDLPAILQKISDQQKSSEIAKNGVISYYIGKYLPYIVAAAVIAIAFPALKKSFKK